MISPFKCTISLTNTTNYLKADGKNVNSEFTDAAVA